MRSEFLILLGIVIVFGCHSKKDRGSIENSKSIEGKYESKKGVKFSPDTSIGFIKLLNANGIGEYLGNDVMDNLTTNELPKYTVISNNLSQELTLVFHPGNNQKEFSEFKVCYNQEKNVHKSIVSEQEFITESGIKLGMDLNMLKSIKGEPNSMLKEKGKVLNYYVDNEIDSLFLERYNLPQYYATYKFQGDSLIEFKFGFEYP